MLVTAKSPTHKQKNLYQLICLVTRKENFHRRCNKLLAAGHIIRLLSNQVNYEIPRESAHFAALCQKNEASLSSRSEPRIGPPRAPDGARNPGMVSRFKRSFVTATDESDSDTTYDSVASSARSN
jgi:hypothetical protein